MSPQSQCLVLRVTNSMGDKAMNYKKIARVEFFMIVAALGIFVPHDSYQMFLAIASAVAAYFIACVLFQSKGARFFFFIPCIVAICQLSVTMKRAITEDGFKQTLSKNPFGFLVADTLYGFRHIVTTALKAFWGFTEVIAYNQYSSIESLNYRFFTMIIMIMVMAVFIFKEKKFPETTDAV